MQLDEKWSFVYKKQKNCDPNEPEDDERGDNWGHIAIDAEHRLVLSVVPGKRTSENAQKLVNDVKKRLDGRVPRLITTDEHSAYEAAVFNAYHAEIAEPRTGRPGRPRKARKEPLPDLTYAVVRKERNEKGRLLDISFLLVFGTIAALYFALAVSKVSRWVNTAFIERHNGTDRNRNSRKVRKSYCFSKVWETHNNVSYFIHYSYNFCWPVRTLRQKDIDDAFHDRTPAMAVGLADHVCPLSEWLSLPSVRHIA